MKIVVAQINFKVGDVRYNAERVIAEAKNAQKNHDADLVVFSELCLSGYPPEDLLYRPALHELVALHLSSIAQSVSIPMVVGFPHFVDGCCYNALAYICGGKIVDIYHKQMLPNYAVFDEKRYFKEGKESGISLVGTVKVGWLICEDIWEPGPISKLKAAGVELVICINASPFHLEKHEDRKAQLQQRFQESNLPIVYVNQVGGQDELVFDGGSLIINEMGCSERVAPFFEQSLAELTFENGQLSAEKVFDDTVTKEALIYEALKQGVKDYVQKNHFKGAVIGLSGGIDSALTLALAVDALGPENVEAVMMPFQYTSQWSLDDAAEQAQWLGVKYHVVPIENLYQSAIDALGPVWGDVETDTTEQNIQARSRGLLLMALSNKTGKIVLTTGNKSEMAVGYATLYGDMAGGFDVLKDVPKMLVYQLAAFRNSISKAIPERVIERAPSAELAPDQVDEDNLPPYEILDKILEMYIEQDMGVQDIIAFGFEEALVKKVAYLVDINEHKRRQAAPGVRITKRAFGKDRRYPITSGFRKQ